MGSSTIQARFKSGLAKAVSKTGSATSERVYRVRKTQTGDPLAPAVTTTTQLLPEAIFKSYAKGLTDINIKAGDRELVSNSDNDIQQGDIIRQGSTDYLVISVDEISPTSDVLGYKSQCRVQ
jgi:hypothetical protein